MPTVYHETNAVVLGDDQYGGASLAGIRFNGADLAAVNWTRLVVLGDEQRARQVTDLEGRKKSKATRAGEFGDAARANRQLATSLREHGLNTTADRMAYKAQVLDRQVLLRQGRLGAALGSLFLDLISGYGYRPLRSFITYLLVVGAFAVVYFLFGHSVHPTLSPVDAVVFSITSFHGRGFSPGEVVTLHNPLTILAAGEAIVGLLIEITFIATFTQRFFAR